MDVRVAVAGAVATAAAVVGAALWRRRSAPALRDEKAVEAALVRRDGPDRERRVQLGPLEAVHVLGSIGEPGPVAVLVPGMWHAAWYFRALQELLRERGVASYALTLRAGYFVGLERHVEDVAAALRALPAGTSVVLCGHSQGGLVVQDLLHSHDVPAVRAVALLGTGALGEKALVDQTAATVRAAVVSRAGWWPYLGMVASLRPPAGNVAALEAMFMRPGTTRVGVTGRDITPAQYLELLRTRPADGWPTYVSNVAKWGSRAVPRSLGSARDVLVVQFEHDACYPQAHTDWLMAQYDGARHLFVRGQGHCGVDPGWRQAYAMPLADWIAEKRQ